MQQAALLRHGLLEEAVQLDIVEVHTDAAEGVAAVRALDAFRRQRTEEHAASVRSGGSGEGGEKMLISTDSSHLYALLLYLRAFYKELPAHSRVAETIFGELAPFSGKVV